MRWSEFDLIALQCDQLGQLGQPLGAVGGPQLFLSDFQEAAQAAQAAAFFNMAVPGSPAQPLRPTNLFGFPYHGAMQPADQQFQAQLLQRLQTLSGYNPARSPTPFGYPQSPTMGYRMASSPVMAQRPQGTPAATPSPTTHSGGFSSGAGGGAVGGQSASGSVSTPQDEESLFIRPLSQVGTLTTTDHEGRTRVIVPVPMDDDTAPRLNAPPGPKGTSPRKQQQQLAAALNSMSSLRVSDEASSQGAAQGAAQGVGPPTRRLGPGGPPYITRSTSEKVPNRSELMTQVTRAAWARHTTK